MWKSLVLIPLLVVTFVPETFQGKFLYFLAFFSASNLEARNYLKFNVVLLTVFVDLCLSDL